MMYSCKVMPNQSKNDCLMGSNGEMDVICESLRGQPCIDREYVCAYVLKESAAIDHIPFARVITAFPTALPPIDFLLLLLPPLVEEQLRGKLCLKGEKERRRSSFLPQ